jgi:hypothetical protein
MKRCSSVLTRTFLILAVLVPIAACLPTGGAVDDGGAGGTGGGMVSCGGSSGTSTFATWTAVREVVDLTCQGSDCHTQGDREPYMIGMTGLMSDADLYSKLTTYKAVRCMDRVMVKPCAPMESAFYLAQMGMCEGLAGVPLPKMPFGCVDYCTSEEKLEGIRQWIANGAPR